jgi:hypothetical protein
LARAAFVAALSVAAVLGGAIAWSTREPYALANVEIAPPRIPQKDNALQQYLYASTVGTDEAWESVIRYYPASSLARRAEQQLARIYFRRAEYDRAMAIFDRFASSTEKDDSLRAFGLAGQYGVLTLRDADRAVLADVLDRLAPIRDKLDSGMQMMLSRAIERNYDKLQDETRQIWEDFVNEVFSGEQFGGG